MQGYYYNNQSSIFKNNQSIKTYEFTLLLRLVSFSNAIAGVSVILQTMVEKSNYVNFVNSTHDLLLF